MQKTRQESFRSLKAKRDSDQKRELRLGYLQNHVRGQEMDFQRLHRIMGVKFTPEKPDSVQDIVKASLSHEQRNASLLHYVGVQTAQIEDIEEQLRDLEAQESSLSEDAQTMALKGVEMANFTARLDRTSEATLGGIAKRDEMLQKLIPVVGGLCTLTGAAERSDAEDGGILSLKGCRPDTLSDYLRLVDVSIKELRARAESLPTATGNEWLRDFLAYKCVQGHPTVTELRKDLEAAAQKQKEQKAEYSSVMGDGPGLAE